MRIFSGIRPSGKLHLGNYLGALKNWIELQDKADSAIFGIVDYHAITTPYDPKTFQNTVLDTACEYLAAGVDPEKALLIRQSRIPQHTELAWLFSTITPTSWVDRMPTYKEQLEKNPKYNHIGLRDYPVLMAADILIYKANTVPVGADQLPHIDITNEIAKKFNSAFGETFEPVKAYQAEGARIMSLSDPTKKMSKTPSAGASSEPQPNSSGQAGDDYIALTDEPDTIREKIKRAVTDSGAEIKKADDKPAISNLLTIYSLLAKKDIPELEAQYKGKPYVEFKNDLAEIVVEFLKPIREKYVQLRKNPDEIESTLTNCEKDAIIIASETLQDVKQKMGF